MKYKDFEGTIQALVDRKLDEIEEMEGVKILHAVESGSRAWGFASPDSDYDVRFVYVRPEQYYLRLDEKKDFINWELDETLDINGWDLSKTLQHFHKSNASLYEWGNSPVVYRTTPEWGEIKAGSERFFSCKAGMYHYYGTARKNFIEYLQGEDVKYKKYFYVLRPILACKWIEERRCPPPVLFSELMGSVLEEEMKPAVDRLIELKVKTPESAAGRKIEELNGYIAEKLDEFKAKTAAMPDDRKEGWDELNSLFIRMAGKAADGGAFEKYE